MEAAEANAKLTAKEYRESVAKRIALPGEQGNLKITNEKPGPIS